MKALLAMLDLGRRQAVGDRDPIRRWHKGRVVVLGDAAHPTLQSLAQGASMAIEDALCLADCMAAANSNFETAFRRYENARVVRTARVTLESRYIWDVYHSDGISRDVYWQMLSERSEADTFRCLAWLYDGFARHAVARWTKGRSHGHPGDAFLLALSATPMGRMSSVILSACARASDQSGLIPAKLITLAHFAVSTEMSSSKSSGEPVSKMVASLTPAAPCKNGTVRSDRVSRAASQAA